MAATIRLVTFSGQTVTPKNDAIVYDASIGRCGVFYGCDVTASGNTIYVSSGYGMIRGRFFEIEASTLPVTLASTDTLLGRLYIRLDLSNTEEPLQLLTVTGSSLPALEQDADANFVDGVWEMELATFTVTTTEVSGVVETYETITDNGSLISALQSAVNMLNSNKMHTPKYSDGTMYCYCFGFVTTNSTVVRLYIPINIAEKLTGISITSVNADVRSSDGAYLGGSLSANLTQYISTVELLRDQGLIALSLTKSSGFGLTNNSVLAGAVSIRISYTTA